MTSPSRPEGILADPDPFKEGHRTALIITTTAGLEREARQEARAALGGADARPLFLKGNVLILTDLPEEEAVARLAAAPTELLARAVPVHKQVAVTTDQSCFAKVATAAAEIGRIQAGELFLVRCQRRGQHEWQARDLERAVAELLAKTTGGVGEYQQAVDWLVSVEVYQSVGFVGVNRPSHVLRKPLLRQRKYAPGERPLNRAQLKLKEALSAFEIALPGNARVLDLGAAPGGWALALAEMGCSVVAVDPADLDPVVARLPNVCHLRLRAEEIGPRDDWQDSFDLLTCDANIDPAQAAEILCALAYALKPGCPAIMTVKFTTRDRRRHQREAREVLAREYQDIHMRHMPHNALETTAVMYRRGGPGPTPN